MLKSAARPLTRFYQASLFPVQFRSISFTIKNLEEQSWTVTGNVGDNVMQKAVAQGVPFEQACGGNAECCTCHMKVPVEELRAQDGEKYAEPTEKEQDGLDFAEGATEESRLACQMRISEACEGKVFVM